MNRNPLGLCLSCNFPHTCVKHLQICILSGWDSDQDYRVNSSESSHNMSIEAVTLSWCFDLWLLSLFEALHVHGCRGPRCMCFSAPSGLLQVSRLQPCTFPQSWGAQPRSISTGTAPGAMFAQGHTSPAENGNGEDQGVRARTKRTSPSKDPCSPAKGYSIADAFPTNQHSSPPAIYPAPRPRGMSSEWQAQFHEQTRETPTVPSHRGLKVYIYPSDYKFVVSRLVLYPF